jgi:predicted nucleotidyltransferase
MRFPCADALRVASYIAEKLCDVNDPRVPKILEVLVFGSTARGEQQVGDLDLFVIFEPINEFERDREVGDECRRIEREGDISGLPFMWVEFVLISATYFRDETKQEYYRRNVFCHRNFVELALATHLRWNRATLRFCPSTLAELVQRLT